MTTDIDGPEPPLVDTVLQRLFHDLEDPNAMLVDLLFDFRGKHDIRRREKIIDHIEVIFMLLAEIEIGLGNVVETFRGIGTRFERALHIAEQQLQPLVAVGQLALVDDQPRVGLAAAGTQRVVLVDLDLQFGDVADALQMRPESSIADLHQNGGVVSPTSLKALLVKRGENLFALAAPANPADGDAGYAITCN